jgi:hypothetical protein
MTTTTTTSNAPSFLHVDSGSPAYRSRMTAHLTMRLSCSLLPILLSIFFFPPPFTPSGDLRRHGSPRSASPHCVLASRLFTGALSLYSTAERLLSTPLLPARIVRLSWDAARHCQTPPLGRTFSPKPMRTHPLSALAYAETYVPPRPVCHISSHFHDI